RWRFASTKTDRLVIAPQDLRTADATRASEIYAGRFAFAGKVVICDRRSPFILQDADARFYRRFIRSLSRQIRYLRRTLNETRDGLPRLQAVIALAYATLCMQGQS